MTSPFKTPEFKELFQRWNYILEKENFKDAEDFTLPEPALKDWHGTNWQSRCPEKMERDRRYYELASQILHTHLFKSSMHRKIWGMHCDGLSVRKIADQLNQRKFRRNKVHLIIIEITVESGLKYDRII